MRELLIDAKKQVAIAKENQQTELSKTALDDLLQHYDQHVEAGLKAHPKKARQEKARASQTKPRNQSVAKV